MAPKAIQYLAILWGSMTFDLLEQNLRARETGRWWDSAFWREGGKRNLVNIEEAFQALIEVYDDRWFLEQSRDSSSHWVYQMLNTRGPYSVGYLEDHGHAIDLAKKAELFGSYGKRIRNSDSFDGANFELRILASLIREGFSISPKPGGGLGKRTCEFRCSYNGEELFIEAKHLERSSWNLNLTELFHRIWNEVNARLRQDGRGFLPFLDLHSEVRHKVMDKEGWKCVARDWQEIADQIVSHCIGRINAESWGYHVVDGLVIFRLEKDSPDTRHTGEARGFGASREAEIHKIRENALLSAVQQLPLGKAGILAVHSELAGHLVLNSKDFESEFFANPHLGGVLFYSSIYEQVHKSLVHYVSNPFASHDITTFRAMSALMHL